MSITLTKPVVTPDDFKTMFGIDLANILIMSDNDSNYPQTFLRLVQDELVDWCWARTTSRKKVSDLQGMQLEAFQRAVLLHVYYTWKNGSLALGLDSGVDSERGRVLTIQDIEAAEVSQRVINLLHNAGMFNLKLKNRPRFNRGYPGLAGSFTGEDY